MFLKEGFQKELELELRRNQHNIYITDLSTCIMNKKKSRIKSIKLHTSIWPFLQIIFSFKLTTQSHNEKKGDFFFFHFRQ